MSIVMMRMRVNEIYILIFLFIVDYVPSGQDDDDEEDDDTKRKRKRKIKAKKVKVPPRITSSGTMAQKPRVAVRDPNTLVGDDTFRKQVDELKYREEKAGRKMFR